MATSPIGLQQGYGIGSGVQNLAPFSIIANRAPTTLDRARIGTFWAYTGANNIYCLTSVTNGNSNWLTLSNGGAGVFLSLTVNGPSTFAGNITQTAGVTTLLQTTINGSLTQDGGATLLNTDGIAQTVNIGTGAAAKTVTLGSTNTTSATNINSGSGKTNFNGTIPGNPGRLNIVENGGGFVIVTSSNNAANTYHLYTQQLSNDAFAPVWNSFKNRAGATVQTNDLLFQQRVAAQGPAGIADSVIMQYQTVGVLPATSIVPVKYTLETGNSVGVLTTKLTVTPDGAVNLPSQPSFFAYSNAAQAPSTGDGTVAQIVFPDVDFNVSNSYNATTGVFTAPVTGKYLFGAALLMGGIAVPMNQLDLYFIVSGAGTGQSVRICSLNPTPVIFAGQFFATTGTHMTEMTAGQTINVRIAITGGALDAFVVGNAGAERRSYFYGQLVA